MLNTNLFSFHLEIMKYKKLETPQNLSDQEK